MYKCMISLRLVSLDFFFSIALLIFVYFFLLLLTLLVSEQEVFFFISCMIRFNRIYEYLLDNTLSGC
jgi:hypothetical protein